MITPTASDRTVRFADFPTLTQALDFAATGETGINLYSLRGELVEALPYAKLRDEAVVLARRLLATGAQVGDSVALLAETDGDFVRAFFACQYAGLLPAPMALPTPLGGREAYIEQITNLARSAKAKILLGPVGLKDWVAEIGQRAGLDFAGVLADLPEDGGAALPTLTPEDPCYLQFSSGSTRTPTGVLVLHKALMANCVAITRDGLQVVPSDRAISWLPLYHDMGLIACLMLPLLCGLPLVLLDPVEWARRPALLLQAVARHRGTLVFLPNFAFHHLALTVPADERADLRSMRVFVNCSETCSESAFARFADRFAANGVRRSMLQTCYAMAEAVFALTQSQPGSCVRSLAEAAPGLDLGAIRIAPDTLSSGRPVADVEIAIRDSRGATPGEGEVGEVHVRAGFLFSGYARGETGAPDDAGWFATGDLGLLRDGELFVVGRAKDVIIVNGRNLLAPEIEALASDVDGIKPGRAVAFGCWQPATGSEALTVLAEPLGPLGDAAGARTLSRRVRQRIFESVGVHPTVRIVPPRTLIKTTSGKLSRARNRQLYEEAR